MSLLSPRHSFQTDDAALTSIADKVLRGERLSFEDGLTLYRSGDILAVGWLANWVREKKHGWRGKICQNTANRHVNEEKTESCISELTARMVDVKLMR